jgi:hypothetical protein
VQVTDGLDSWIESRFPDDEYVKAYRRWELVKGESIEVRIVEVVTETTVSQTQVWPFAWTESGCHYNGLADHASHVTHARRGQFCRGNGPMTKPRGWTPSDDDA